jgi:hypothetical protein
VTVVWVVMAAVVVLAVLSLSRFRPGGPGPAVQWVPRSLRPRLNQYYNAKGWTAPFTEEGERNPERRVL